MGPLYVALCLGNVHLPEGFPEELRAVTDDAIRSILGDAAVWYIAPIARPLGGNRVAGTLRTKEGLDLGAPVRALRSGASAPSGSKRATASAIPRGGRRPLWPPFVAAMRAARRRGAGALGPRVMPSSAATAASWMTFASSKEETLGSSPSSGPS